MSQNYTGNYVQRNVYLGAFCDFLLESERKLVQLSALFGKHVYKL